VLKRLRAGFSGGAPRAAKKAELHCGVCRLDFKEEEELHYHALALHLRPVFACQLCHFKVFAFLSSPLYRTHGVKLQCQVSRKSSVFFIRVLDPILCGSGSSIFLIVIQIQVSYHPGIIFSKDSSC
jgi:hypothetical protein